MAPNVCRSQRMIAVIGRDGSAVSVVDGELSAQGYIVLDVDVMHATSLSDDVVLERDGGRTRRNISAYQGSQEPYRGGRNFERHP